MNAGPLWIGPLRLEPPVVLAPMAGVTTRAFRRLCRRFGPGGLLTAVSTGRIAEAEGAAAVALHARTAEQRYAGDAAWPAIAELKAAVTTIPVLGNGDIWEADDAVRMMDETGCDGVVIGRGCLGRPWLFADLGAVFAGRPPAPPPAFGVVAGIMRRPAELLAEDG